MRKVFSLILVLVLIVLVVLVGKVVKAGKEILEPMTKCILGTDYPNKYYPACPEGGKVCLYSSDDKMCAICCLIDRIFFFGDRAFAVAIGLSIFFGLWSAIDIIASGGDETKYKKGKTKLLYTLIGVGVALLSKSIPVIVASFIH